MTTAKIRMLSLCQCKTAIQQCKFFFYWNIYSIYLTKTFKWTQIPRYGHHSYGQKVHSRRAIRKTTGTESILKWTWCYRSGKSQSNEINRKYHSSSNCLLFSSSYEWPRSKRANQWTWIQCVCVSKLFKSKTANMSASASQFYRIPSITWVNIRSKRGIANFTLFQFK